MNIPVPLMPFSVPRRSPPELPPESGDPFCEGGKMRSMSLAMAEAMADGITASQIS